MVYRYVQARYDYGRRKTTLGLCFHGAEAESGVVGYLSRDPSRGVSANFVCERRTGRMVQMLPLANASGSMNPRDRSTNKAYYGHDHLVDVLGDYWTDPNAAVISVEIEMYARKGPDAAQVTGLIAWANDMKARYPGIRGAIGHADQTDTKPCPGTTPAMKAVFDAIGGHGLWAPPTEEDVNSIYLPLGGPGTFRIIAGATVRGYEPTETGWSVAKTLTAASDTGAHYSALLQTRAATPPTSILLVDTGYFKGLYVSTAEVVDETPDPPPPPPGATVLTPGIYEVRT